MADFFVLTRDDEFRRLPVERGIQVRLDGIFQEGVARLADGDLEIVPFGRFAFQPDDTQIWSIDGFALPRHLQEAVNEPLACPPLITADAVDVSLKAVVASFPNDGSLAFQVLDRRMILEPRGLTLLLAGDTFRQLREPGLQLSDDVHVLLHGRQLRFKSAYWARRVFDVRQFYIEATEEEVDSWVARDDLAFEGDLDAYRDGLSQWERKRIGFILSSGILDRVEVPVIRERAREYGLEIGVVTDGQRDRLVVPDDAAGRRRLIKFLEEDYYKGPLSDNAYIANSKRLL